MQALFAELFWPNEEISQAVACLCEDIPGYQSAREEYNKIVSQLQEIIGFELCSQLSERLTELDGYEEYACYAVGLRLREAVFKSLCV
ncbi:hypothetical protein [Flintibacter muris]|uniref:hypothetical protein n=1 Tax=Flintibacter muris TaxID=2941327 RepID=UPI0020419F22|nr:hypothetical protein [Flintibacter muris]